MENQTTLLPPRKRLLCELKHQRSSIRVGHLQSRIDELFHLSDVSLAKVVDRSKVTASDAANAAAAASKKALEKAEAAVRAKFFARSVLELVPPFYGRKKRGRKKPRCVPVERLYMPDSVVAGKSVDADEEQRIHVSIGTRNDASKKRGRPKTKKLFLNQCRGTLPLEVDSTRKCKKLKVSQLYPAK